VQESNLLNEPQLPDQALRFLIPQQKYPARASNADLCPALRDRVEGEPA
jgi:hypothetical protein